MSAALTVSAGLRDAASRLKAAGIPESLAESLELLSSVLHKDKSYLYAHPETVLTPVQRGRFARYLRGRQERRPLQYLTRRCDFFGMEFHVDESVLVPRPETELLAEKIMARLQGAGPSPRVLDLGTGSGCLAAVLARHLRARVWATDLSGAALAVARRNIRRHGLAGRVTLRRGDLFGALPGRRHRGFFDAIVSNPPYVPESDRPGLAPEVLREPARALFGGENGLFFLEKVIGGAGFYLRPGGWLGLEIGFGQSLAVKSYLRRSGFEGIEVIQDWQGIDRTVLARKPVPIKKTGKKPAPF